MKGIGFVAWQAYYISAFAFLCKHRCFPLHFLQTILHFRAKCWHVDRAQNESRNDVCTCICWQGAIMQVLHFLLLHLLHCSFYSVLLMPGPTIQVAPPPHSRDFTPLGTCLNKHLWTTLGLSTQSISERSSRNIFCTLSCTNRPPDRPASKLFSLFLSQLWIIKYHLQWSSQSEVFHKQRAQHGSFIQATWREVVYFGCCWAEFTQAGI